MLEPVCNLPACQALLVLLCVVTQAQQQGLTAQLDQQTTKVG